MEKEREEGKREEESNDQWWEGGVEVLVRETLPVAAQPGASVGKMRREGARTTRSWVWTATRESKQQEKEQEQERSNARQVKSECVCVCALWVCGRVPSVRYCTFGNGT